MAISAPTAEVAALPSGAGQSQWNAIDACWRGPGSKWWADRKRLANCAIGFGRGTTGGKAGAIYVVTSNADDARNPRPGTLRYGVIQDVPLWITFARDMTITLANELVIASDKTIDGRGAQVHIANGPCLSISYVTNVIVHGLHIHDCTLARPGLVRLSPSRVDFRSGSSGDAIHILASRNVWIDHNSLSSSFDGLVDVTHASTSVTISNNFFFHHDKTMLLGHSDLYSADKAMRVTVAFNHFGPGLVQRLPR
jgi:pectate lyase